MRVKCIDVDEKGKVRLSRKAAIKEEGDGSEEGGSDEDEGAGDDA